MSQYWRVDEESSEAAGFEGVDTAFLLDFLGSWIAQSESCLIEWRKGDACDSNPRDHWHITLDGLD
jgi:hypothetical protein